MDGLTFHFTSSGPCSCCLLRCSKNLHLPPSLEETCVLPTLHGVIQGKCGERRFVPGKYQQRKIADYGRHVGKALSPITTQGKGLPGTSMWAGTSLLKKRANGQGHREVIHGWFVQLRRL